MAYYEKDIRFENENILTDKFSFAKMQFQEDTPKLTITDAAEISNRKTSCYAESFI